MAARSQISPQAALEDISSAALQHMPTTPPEAETFFDAACLVAYIVYC